MGFEPFDNYLLTVTLLITIAHQLICATGICVLKYYNRERMISNYARGTNFILLFVPLWGFDLAWDVRQVLVSLFLALSTARPFPHTVPWIGTPTSHARSPNDAQFWSAFVGRWVGRIVCVWTAALPMTVLCSPNVTRFKQPGFRTGRDIGGMILYAIGFAIAGIADFRRFQFQKRRPPPTAILNYGLFSWSRHPECFGEILMHFAVYMMAVSPATEGFVRGPAAILLHATILGPVVVTVLLMFVGGIRLQERPEAKERYERGFDWAGYRQYLHRTSILLPCPPQVYAGLPRFIKRTIFLEFPIYIFNPQQHAEAFPLHHGTSGWAHPDLRLE